MHIHRDNTNIQTNKQKREHIYINIHQHTQIHTSTYKQTNKQKRENKKTAETDRSRFKRVLF